MGNPENEKGLLTVYELGYLILPSVSEDKLPEVVNLIKEIFIKEGGKEIDGELPQNQPLAYSMSKTVGANRYVVTEAYLGWMKFEVEPAKILKIRANIEKIAEILRFILVKALRETTFTFAKARAVTEEAETAISGSDKEIMVE